MLLYISYRIGYFIANSLPLKFSYAIASFVARIFCFASFRDRKAIIRNLRTISSAKQDERELARMALELYRNFAKYLVDFFTFRKIDEEYVRKFVNVEGAANIDTALAKGKGVILLSAHIGNWELGGSVVSIIGYPLSAVVLPHQNKQINEFFNKQRLAGRFTPIEMGVSIKECYRLLKENKVLALLGDRDFNKNGLMLDFFGRKTLFPKGPAVFSYRLGSAIVPTILVRESDDTFRMIFDEPIYADKGKPEDAAVMELAGRCAAIIERYVKTYPTQWYIFKDMWSKDE